MQLIIDVQKYKYGKFLKDQHLVIRAENNEDVQIR